MKKCSLSLFFLVLLASCSSTSTAIVSREELRPSSSPNIQQVNLTGGQVIIFNSNLGWYNAERAYIEGEDLLGERDTIPLSQVEEVRTVEHHPNTVTAILLILLVLTIGVAFALYYTFFSPGSRGGCVILISVIILSSVTTMAAVVFILGPMSLQP